MNESEDASMQMGSAHILEMVVPPFCVILIIYFGFLLLSLITQPLWWARCLSVTKDKPMRRVRVSSFETIKFDPSENFLGTFDRNTLLRFQMFQNNPKSLISLSLPAILSLAFCPATLYFAPMVTRGVWPENIFPMRPNVNDAIACFLTPSGLVYAIAFGFAFQEALTKQTTLANFFCERLSTLQNLMFLINCIKTHKPKVKAALMMTLKDEVVTWMRVILKKKDKQEFQIDTHRMMLILENEGLLQQSDSKLLDELWENVKALRAMGPDKTTVLLYASHVSFLQWLFLEALGFVCYFGVLLIKAQSYRMELAMCMLTVFTISLFVNVLADYDTPLHGFFKLSLKDNVDIINEMEEQYHVIIREIPSKINPLISRLSEPEGRAQ